MKKSLIRISFIPSIFVFGFFGFFIESSRISEACVDNMSCENLTDEMFSDQPYCVSDSVDNSNCVLLGLTNTGSLKSVESVRSIIEKYCKQSLGLDKRDGRIYYAKPSVVSDYDGWDWQQTFDSNQSLFVYALCSSFEGGEDRPFLKGGSAVLSEAFQSEDIAKILKLQQLSENKDNCSLIDRPDLNDCDMSLYVTEIFSSLMSEIFKIGYAQIFNVNTAQDYETKQSEMIVNFLSGYYGITEDYDKVRNRFPQTVNIMKSDQGIYKKVLDKLKLINNSELASLTEDDGACPETGDVRGLQYLACALHGSEGNGVALSRSFLTMCYNELLNYRLFVEFYTRMLRKMIKEGVETKKMTETMQLLFEAQALDLENYSEMQIAAFRQTLSDMEDVSMTYPLHIGLLLYQERLKNYRNNYLSPVVTVFYSLSEKLQNVQIPAEN